ILTGDWLASAYDAATRDGVRDLLDAAGNAGISFEASQLGRWDTSLLLFVSELRQSANKRGIPFDDKGLPVAAARLLSLVSAAAPAAARARHPAGVVSRVGQAALGIGDAAVSVATLVGDVMLSGGAALRGR